MKLFACLGLTAAVTCFIQGACAADFDQTTNTVGRQPGGLVTPVNQLVTPAGIPVPLPGMRPNALALSPDGQLLVTSGLTNELAIVDPATGKIRQQAPFPRGKHRESLKPTSPLILNANDKPKLSFTGLVFSPDGRRIYLSNVNGDIKVFSVSEDRKVSPLNSLPLPRPGAAGRKTDIPTGLAVAPDGDKIYVALNVANQVAELDTRTGRLLRRWDTGEVPYDVVLCRNKLYVSNWGGRRPDATSTVGPVGSNGVVRVDAHSVASEGSVSIIDLSARTDAPAPNPELLTGRHACAMALSPDENFLACANAGDDSVSIIDTRTDQIVETLSVRQNPGDRFGAQPDALAFDESGRTLFVGNGTQNAVAVFDFQPGRSKLRGLIPVGWFPCAMAFDAPHHQLDVANIKDIAPQKEKTRSGKGRGFNSKQYQGSLSLVPVPTESELAKLTQTALADLRYPLLAQAELPPRPGLAARPVPERAGEPSVFQHVIYIIKENRSYDQVLGDVTAGNGDTNLCVFGQRVTPNQHQLVRQFALLDNTYCCSILSADGHNWTDSGIVTDYLEREFAGWPRSYPAGGDGLGSQDALAYSPAGFIWNDAAEHGKTVADFGEFTTDHKHRQGFLHWGKPRWSACYRDFVKGANQITYTATPDIESLRPWLITNTIGWDLAVPDVWRAAQFIKDLKQFEAADTLPNLLIVWLPNDHTSGTKYGSPTPAAQVADNDLALGRIVDAVSHSKFWTNTCIFAIEDDPQDGWDHVSGYRTTAYVASAWTKRGRTIHTQYNQTSLLRTMELMLGLPPMNQMDATATPMFDCFTDIPDFTPFDAVPNRVPLDQMNPLPKSIHDRVLRRDAYLSARLPLAKADQCPDDVFNRILWDAAKGPQTPYPGWAVKGDDDD